jgi:hypothetical protein
MTPLLAIKNKVTVVIIATVIVLINISPAFAIEYGGFGGRPAHPVADNPRTESIFVYTLDRGVSKDDGVIVINNTALEKTLLVYATDSTPSTGGAFACKQMSEEKDGVGSWIALAKNEVVLPPSTNEIIPFTLNVPQSAGVGEHNGCILIQEKKEKVEGQSGAILSVRSGLRVAVTIPGDIVRELEFAGFNFTKKDGIFLMHPLVKNLGNVSIDAKVNVVTRYFFGLKYLTHGGGYPILRGETSDWNFELKKPFWGGLYKTELVIEYDKNSEAGIGVNSGKTTTVLKSPAIWFWSAPTLWALLIEILVLALIVLGIVLAIKKVKSNKWIKNNWVEQKVGENDDVMTLAEKHKIAWKQLVKVNGLKAPYAIKAGQKIKVPPTK